jgi:hypothetical protein
MSAPIDGEARVASAPYHPFFCEENVWHLLRSPKLTAKERYAVFITNPSRQVALWQQRLAPEGEPVVWDYHVVAVTRDPSRRGHERVWDRDSRLPFPCPIERYFRDTFPALPLGAESLAPQFRFVAFADFDAKFSSDRRHMRRGDGSWLQAPPSWPAIGTGHTLDRFLDLGDDIGGTVVGLDALGL